MSKHELQFKKRIKQTAQSILNLCTQPRDEKLQFRHEFWFRVVTDNLDTLPKAKQKIIKGLASQIQEQANQRMLGSRALTLLQEIAGRQSLTIGQQRAILSILQDTAKG